MSTWTLLYTESGFRVRNASDRNGRPVDMGSGSEPSIVTDRPLRPSSDDAVSRLICQPPVAGVSMLPDKVGEIVTGTGTFSPGSNAPVAPGLVLVPPGFVAAS